jgi:hypothetical protein
VVSRFTFDSQEKKNGSPDKSRDDSRLDSLVWKEVHLWFYFYFYFYFIIETIKLEGPRYDYNVSWIHSFIGLIYFPGNFLRKCKCPPVFDESMQSTLLSNGH